MPLVTPEKLISLQRRPDEVRNICILAHVDHGKTSLTDALIATNGIISPKLAGKIRYLDSRPDEQLRGITMESSAISLYFSMLRRSSPEAEPEPKEYLINLIDSPGHIDFSSEVSTASRLTDGALVLVDAIEGVQSQTVTVLRHTWTEHLKPLLVINKIDRLITERKLSASEAYSHLSRLLEQINAVIGSFFQGERMEEDLQWREKVEKRAEAAAERKAAQSDGLESLQQTSLGGEFEETDDEDLYFSPEKNNVIFSSALDGWAFTIRQFASMYEKKLGLKRSVLERVLWGDYYLEPKTKRILGSKHLKGRNLKPMFVQLVLDNIWAVYSASTGGSSGRGDPAMLEKITSSLSIKLPPHVLRSKESHSVLTALFAAWLPLSTAILVSTVEYLPAPPVSQPARLPLLLDSSPGASFIAPATRDAMTGLKSGKEDPVVAFVSKMIAVRESELSKRPKAGNGAMTGEEARDLARKKRAELQKVQAQTASEEDGMLHDLTQALDSTDLAEPTQRPEDVEEDPEHLIGFARTYSGTLSVGDKVFVLAPKFTPADPHAEPEPKEVTITGLYLLMGRGLESLEIVPPGVVCGIAGLEGNVLKSATLCSKVDGAPNLAGVIMGAQPIVRVALEPTNPGDLNKMIRGMKLLEQSDPCARYEVLDSGEHVILTAGELHLERCIKDLKERFAKCDVQPGEPIVPFRETIVSDLEMAPLKDDKAPRGTVTVHSHSGAVSIRFRTLPLPVTVADFLEKSATSIRHFYAVRSVGESDQPRKIDQEQSTNNTFDPSSNEEPAGSDGLLSLLDFRENLNKAFSDVKTEDGTWDKVVEKITSFGPRRSGPNILIDATKQAICQKFLQEGHPTSRVASETPEFKQGSTTLQPQDLTDKIIYAFQLATAQGPMCHEPLRGVAVFLESIDITPPSSTTESETASRLTGEILKLTTQAIHAGFLSWSPRLMLASYICTIQTQPAVLGRTYSTLSKLHATIISEDMAEGTPFYSITCLLPLVTSFHLGSELLKSTSGAAQPQLVFHGFEILGEDPYWVPRSEEELEDFGEKGDRERWSKVLMEGVRRRKGLVVRGERVIKEGEKQKTLKR